jgi:hypothetical protein
MSDPAPGPPGWPARRLVRVGCLLPIAALVLFLLVFLAWPVERHQDASDFHTVMFFLALAFVPIAALAGIVLAIMALMRARRERPGGRMLVRPVIAILSAIVCVALLALVIWAALTGLARFR